MVRRRGIVTRRGMVRGLPEMHVAWPWLRGRWHVGLARPCPDPDLPALGRSGAAGGGQEGRHPRRLFLDQRAGGPAAVQALRAGDRHQGAIRARLRLRAHLAHVDRVPRRPARLRHRAHDHDQQAAAADAGAIRAAGGQEHSCRRARQGPALVRRVRQLQLALLQHQDGEARAAAEDLRGILPAQGMGRQGRHRRHRQRMAARALRCTTARRRPTASPATW